MKKDTQYLYKAYQMLGTVPTHFIYILTYLILTTTLRGWDYNYSHFIQSKLGHKEEIRF